MADFLVKQGHEIAGSNLVNPSSKADKTDLSSIIQTGTASSQAISAGTYFYLNDVLVRAKVDIANGATFTLNTNYEVVTAGGLNATRIKSVELSGNTGASGNVALSKITYPNPINAIMLTPDNSSFRITGGNASNWYLYAYNDYNNTRLNNTAITYRLYYTD